MVKNKKWYNVYGTHEKIEYLLGKISSIGNAYSFAEAMKKLYTDVRIE